MKNVLEPAYVQYQGRMLPPKSMRLGSMPGKSDKTYVQYAAGSVKLIEKAAGASKKSRILDIGSGPGRLMIGIQARWGSVAKYCGLDVNRQAVEWATTYLATEDNIEFRPLDIRSERYNPGGTKIAQNFRFPLSDSSFDLAVLLSVFSHMRLAEIAIYLDDLRRVLSPDGKIFCTLFVEDDVPVEEENPGDYIANWSGPLHCVRLNRINFERVISDHGWRPVHFAHQAMSSGQSIYVLARN